MLRNTKTRRSMMPAGGGVVPLFLLRESETRTKHGFAPQKQVSLTHVSISSSTVLHIRSAEVTQRRRDDLRSGNILISRRKLDGPRRTRKLVTRINGPTNVEHEVDMTVHLGKHCTFHAA